jgi:hypothetical protein
MAKQKKLPRKQKKKQKRKHIAVTTETAPQPIEASTLSSAESPLTSSIDSPQNLESPKSAYDEENRLNFFEKINRGELVALALLVIVTAAAYSNTLNSSFHLDDKSNIWNNPSVFMREITLETLYDATFNSYTRTRPVANVTFALNYYFHNLNLPGYHITNIFIHIATGIFLYFLLKATLSLPTLRDNFDRQGPMIIAFITATIWLLHPLQTQSVTYVVQRMNSMFAMFYILAMLLYVKGRLTTGTKNRWFLYGGCLLSFILSLGSKELAATLPIFIFLYEWYFLQDLRSIRSISRRQWFMLALALLVFVGLAFFYVGGDPIKSLLTNEISGREFTRWERFLTETRVVLMYISLIFFPHLSRLNLDYDFPLSHSPAAPPVTLLAIAVLVGMALVAVLITKRQRLYSFCIIWFLGNLVIESSFVPLELVFEHRTYLPSTFFLLLAVVPLYRLLFKNRKVFYTICAVILVTLPILTYERNKVWKDNMTLWLDCLKKSPNKYRVHWNVAHEYGRLWKTDKAIHHLRKTLKLRPNVIKPRIPLALMLARKGRYQEAIIELNILLSMDPGNTEAQNKLQAFQQYRRQQLQQR